MKLSCFHVIEKESSVNNFYTYFSWRHSNNEATFSSNIKMFSLLCLSPFKLTTIIVPKQKVWVYCWTAFYGHVSLILCSDACTSQEAAARFVRLHNALLLNVVSCQLQFDFKLPLNANWKHFIYSAIQRNFLLNKLWLI